MEKLIELFKQISFFLLVLCVTGDKILEIHKKLKDKNEKRFTPQKSKSLKNHRFSL